jgi:hypothetical protein
MYFEVPNTYIEKDNSGTLSDKASGEPGPLVSAEFNANPALVPLPASAGVGFSMLGGFGVLGFLRKRFTSKVRIV